MSRTHRFEEIKKLKPRSLDRTLAVVAFLAKHPKISDRAAVRAGVHKTLISKVLHGVSTNSPRAEAALIIEQRRTVRTVLKTKRKRTGGAARVAAA